MAVARPAIMPHVSSSGGGDDLGSEDEVKVFKDEGEEEKRSSENLTEDKSDLIDLTESEVRRISSLTHRQHSNSPLLQPPRLTSLFRVLLPFFPPCSRAHYPTVFPYLLASTLVAVRTP